MPVFAELWMFGKRVSADSSDLLDSPLRQSSSLKIPYSPDNNLSLTLRTDSVADPVYARIRHRIAGQDTPWKYAGSNQQISLQHLAPGIHTLEAQSSLDGENWNQNTSTLELEILPVWYQRWWAKWSIGAIALSSLSLFLAWTLYYYPFRVQQQQQELEVKKKKTESELARQLQRGMLLERTAEEMHGRSDSSLEVAIKQLGEFFKADRAHLHLYDKESPNSLELSTEHSRGFHVATVAEMQFPDIDLPFVRRALGSDEAVTCTDVVKSSQFANVRHQMQNLGTRSILAMRTAYGTEVNGLIVLHQSEKPRRWQKEEIELLKTIAGQIGILIAQLRLTERDKRQRELLEDSRKVAEAARAEAVKAQVMAENANQAKSEFLAKMTHELRTPLNAILGFAEIIRRDSDTTETQRETLEIIHNSGEHLLSIINDVLEMSKIEAGRVEMIDKQFDFIRMLKSVHEMLDFKAAEKGLKLSFRKNGELPRHIVSDEAKLRQVIINLLSNSLKFTDVGTISLRVHSEPADDGIAVLHFEVSDTGKGISEEELPKLFKKFVQTESGKASSEGTGLGLTISRSFIQHMGGDISVSSTLGKGTTFTFHIKAKVCEVKATPVKARERRITGLVEGQRSPKVLIVDDQMVNRMLLVRLLKPVGFELCEAENGRDALEKWAEFSPDLILMDQDMPEMNGTEATQAILSRSVDPPVIVALTAFAMEETRAEILKTGCTDFLSKPFKNHELFGLLEKHLGVEYAYGDVRQKNSLSATQ